jgi:hypothetical protein
MPVVSPNVNDRQPLLSIVRNKGTGNFRGIISGVIEELNLQPVPRVIKSAGSFKESANHIALIVNRELNSHLRKVFVPRRSFELSKNTVVLHQSFFAAAAKPQEQDIAVGAVEKKAAQTEEVKAA